MKLITKEIEQKLEASPLYSKDGEAPENVQVVAKFFNAYGAGTWYITEGERQGDDWLFFGLCSIHEAELGYMTLSEFESVSSIERDLHWSGTLADARKAEGI
tara:strand:+ start:95 stop:400 length:306 start_codon:yes stop_codon:yes gene_type:complete